jgi:hypothetical protein
MEKVQKNSVNSVQHTPSSESFQVYQSWYSLPNMFLKIPLSTSMHFATRVMICRVARLYSVLYSEIAVSRKPFGIGRVHMHIFA